MRYAKPRLKVGDGYLIYTIFVVIIAVTLQLATAAQEGVVLSDADVEAADEVHSFRLKYDPFTIFTFFCIALSLVLASGSGIGGGGILVPLYILMLGAPGKVAIPLSNITILGGGIGNNIFNLPKRHPVKDRPMIDYDTVVMLEPLTIFGAVLGSFFNKILPDFVLILLLAVSLVLTALRTMNKGFEAWAKESESMRAEQGVDKTGEVLGEKKSSDAKGDFRSLPLVDEDGDDEESFNSFATCNMDGSEVDRVEKGAVELTNIEINVQNDDQAEYEKLPMPNKRESLHDIDTNSGSFSRENMSGIEALSQWVTSKEAELKRQGTEIMKHTSLADGEGLSIKMSEKEIKHAALAIIEDEERHHPLWKIGFLSSCFVGVMFMDYMKDIQQCGTTRFWLWTALVLPWTLGYTLAFRHYLMKRHALKVKMDYEFVDGDVLWGPRETIIYPLCCTAAGILAGLFGVGGGMIKGPLVLEMGLTPLQAHATGMFMILFTSGSACITFYFFGQLNLDAGSVLFLMGLGCTAFGQKLFDIIVSYSTSCLFLVEMCYFLIHLRTSHFVTDLR